MRKFILVTSVAVCVMGAPAFAAHGTSGAPGKTYDPTIENAGTFARLDLGELQTLGGRDAILRASPEPTIQLATAGGHGSHIFRENLFEFLEELIERICERSGGEIVTPSTPGGLPGCIHKKKKHHHHHHHGNNGYGNGGYDGSPNGKDDESR